MLFDLALGHSQELRWNVGDCWAHLHSLTWVGLVRLLGLLLVLYGWALEVLSTSWWTSWSTAWVLSSSYLGILRLLLLLLGLMTRTSVHLLHLQLAHGQLLLNLELLVQWHLLLIGWLLELLRVLLTWVLRLHHHV